MSKRRALGHGQPPPRPPPSLNSLLHEDSTSESEREDDEYAEQVQHFRAVFKRKLFSATSLDLEGWEPAEDDATASTVSASEACLHDAPSVVKVQDPSRALGDE